MGATASMEVDVAFIDDPHNHKSDQVDGAIGELSPFHGMKRLPRPRGQHRGRDAAPRVAKPPDAGRVPGTRSGTGLHTRPHDCVVSKLVAGREKDHAFATALIEAGLINPAIVATRIDTLEVNPRVMHRRKRWIGVYTKAK